MLDGSEKQFFDFLEDYRRLISAHVPGNFVFEYDFPLYMLPVHGHLEKLVAELKPGAKVLDLGCGRGHFGAYLKLRGLDVQGLEVRDPQPGDDLFHNQDRASIGHYTRLWKAAGRRYKVPMRYYGGAKLPLKSASLDAVLFYASYEHVSVDKIAAVTAEAFRVLKPGGKAYIFRCPSSSSYQERFTLCSGLGGHSKLYGKAEILGLLQRAGFEVLEFSRTDLFPAFVPDLPGLRWLQRPLNRAARPLLAVEKLLQATPLAWVFHHFQIVARKKKGAAAPETIA